MSERVNTYSNLTGDEDEYLPIGEIAKAFGVTVPTIRAWDRDGRIRSTRTPTGHRRFARSEIARLRAGDATATP